MSNTINKPLAAKVLAAILEFPNAHDQETWMTLSAPTYQEYLDSIARGEKPQPIDITCGSSACAAGWATHLHGDLIDIDEVTFDEDRGAYTVGRVRDKETGKSWSPGYRAAELLGLTDEDLPGLLFDDDVKEKHVVKALAKLVAGESEAKVAAYLYNKMYGEEDY